MSQAVTRGQWENIIEAAYTEDQLPIPRLVQSRSGKPKHTNTIGTWTGDGSWETGDQVDKGQPVAMGIFVYVLVVIGNNPDVQEAPIVNLDDYFLIRWSIELTW